MDTTTEHRHHNHASSAGGDAHAAHGGHGGHAGRRDHGAVDEPVGAILMSVDHRGGPPRPAAAAGSTSAATDHTVIEPSSATLQDGLWATSQRWPAGSAK